MKTIQLTDEQFTALQAGESITLEPPKKKNWEPEGGHYYVDNNNEALFSRSTNKCRLSGRERETRELAARAAKASRKRDRLEALRDELWPDWEANWEDENQEKWSIRYEHNDKKYMASCNKVVRAIGAVYGSKEFAERACEMLNSGRMEL